jgi:hypothetical protein
VGKGAREGQAVTGPDDVLLDLVEPELHLALHDVDDLLAVVVVRALGPAARLDQVYVRLEQLSPDRQGLDPDPAVSGVQDRALGRLDQPPRRPFLIAEKVGDTDTQRHRQPLQAGQ